MAKKNSPKRILRRAEVRARVGYSDVHIWRLEKAGKFPKRIKLGPKSVGWLEHEVEAWIEKKIDEREVA